MSEWAKNNPEKVKAASAKYYLANRDAMRAKSRERYKLFPMDPEKIKAKTAMYYQNNRAKRDAANRAWALENPEKVAATKRKYYANNKEKILAYNKKWAEGNPERMKELSSSRNTKARAAGKLSSQLRRAVRDLECGGRPDVCQVCRNTGRKIHWDHDHATGKFRGWLCSNCNMALGLISDSPEILRLLAEYLENSK